MQNILQSRIQKIENYQSFIFSVPRQRGKNKDYRPKREAGQYGLLKMLSQSYFH